MGGRIAISLALILCCSIGTSGKASEAPKPIKCVGHTGPVTAVAVSPDGTRAASVSYTDNTLRMWDTANGKELFKRDVFKAPARGGHANDVEFTPDGKLVVVCASGVPRYWETENGKEVESDCAPAEYALDLAISPDGKLLAFARMGTVEIWNSTDCKRKHKFPSGENPELIGVAASVAFSPDGKLLAASYWGKSGFVAESAPRVLVWDCVSGDEVFAGWKSRRNVWGVGFSPDGKLLAAVGGVGQLRVWNFQTQKILYTIGADKNVGQSLAFSADGKALASGGNDSVRLWDVATSKSAGELKGHTAGVRDIAYSSDGRFLVSGSDDHLVIIWPLK